jgi:hypothetical protein
LERWGNWHKGGGSPSMRVQDAERQECAADSHLLMTANAKTSLFCAVTVVCAISTGAGRGSNRSLKFVKLKSSQFERGENFFTNEAEYVRTFFTETYCTVLVTTK